MSASVHESGRVLENGRTQAGDRNSLASDTYAEIWQNDGKHLFSMHNVVLHEVLLATAAHLSGFRNQSLWYVDSEIRCSCCQ